MQETEFYNIFHRNTGVQNKIIDKKNFTYRLVVHFLDKYIKSSPKISILDFGCGSGTLSLYLANQGHSVIGIDISSEAIAKAKLSANANGLDKLTRFYLLKESTIRINKIKFDAILCIEVLEHIKRDTALLKRLSSALKKGGTLILSTPSADAPLHKLGLASKFDKNVGHKRRYTSSRLEKLIRSTDLEILENAKTEGILRNSFYVFPLLGNLVRIFKGSISDLVTLIDKKTIHLLGESDLFVIAKKK